MLGKEGVDVGGAVFDLPVGFPGKLPEHKGEKDDEGNKAQYHQGQLVVQNQHGAQHAKDHKEILCQIHQNIGEHHGNGVGIVSNSGDQFAHGDRIELLA